MCLYFQFRVQLLIHLNTNVIPLKINYCKNAKRNICHERGSNHRHLRLFCAIPLDKAFSAKSDSLSVSVVKFTMTILIKDL